MMAFAGFSIEQWPSSVLVVCRRQASGRSQADYAHVRARIRARVRQFLEMGHTGDVLPEHLLIAAIGPALEVFGQYRSAVKSDGKCATVFDVLDEVQEEVVDFSLIQESEGDGSADK